MVVCVSEQHPLALHEDGRTCWYIGIGAMVNPTVIRLRKVQTMESYPCKVDGYELHFKYAGMASAEQSSNPRAYLHGVVHRITLEDMMRLDEMESVYLKHTVDAQIYHPEPRNLKAVLYYFDRSKLPNMKISLPSARYLEIIYSGCKHYQIAQEWLDYIQSQEKVPRKSKSELLSWPENKQRLFTPDEVFQGTGRDGNPLYIVINDKVLNCDVSCKSDIHFYLKKFAGMDITMNLAFSFYDPAFDPPTTIEALPPEQKLFLEDMLISFSNDAKMPYLEKFTVEGYISSIELTHRQVELYGSDFFTAPKRTLAN